MRKKKFAPIHIHIMYSDMKKMAQFRIINKCMPPKWCTVFGIICF